MGVLQKNLTLKIIGLEGSSWATAGKAARIEGALKRNARQDSYFEILREAKLKFDGARTDRLFLCGSPHAGKTQLRETLERSIRGIFRLKYKITELFRTKGIEVELLLDNKQM